MRHFKQLLVAVAFAGSALASTQARAIEPGFLACNIVCSTPDMVFIEAVVDPTLANTVAFVSFAPLPGADVLVTAVPLQLGANILPVPNFPIDGTYTIEAAGRVKTCEDNEVGAQ